VLLAEKACSVRGLRFNSLHQFRLSMNILAFVPFIAPPKEESEDVTDGGFHSGIRGFHLKIEVTGSSRQLLLWGLREESI
jgi:hypothetical protein